MKPHLNRGLFSNYYLEELLPKEEEFKIPLSELERALEEIKRVWDKRYLSTLNEPQLRKHFLDKVFEILGWAVDVEPPTPSGEWARHPDYALFDSNEDLKLTQEAPKEEYFKSTLCLGEAKRWGRPLDKKMKADLEDPQNPSLQISRYLWLTEVKWGILTDGRRWRLYERETSKRLDIFYEIDLEDLIENGSIQDFKYFYLFFRKHAFPAFLAKIYKESVDYAEAVGEQLKENVYHALKIVAQGFLKSPENGLKEIHLKEIHDNSLILLYRFLFILYAEYRGLLPVGENHLYTASYSLDVFKKEIADKLDKHQPIASSTHGYWNKLKELFEIINIGNPELGVPPYNGGLFDPDKYRFLERYKVGDLYVAKAVDLLTRSSDRAYIDYGSLETRHLGSIYEGLLEYKLKIAENDLVPAKDKGKEVFIHLEDAKATKKKIKEGEIVREGELYLATDRGERKATGSYYTPGYIVNYIIDNTIGPLVERIYRESKLAQEIKNNIRHLNEIFEEIVEERGEEEKENLLKLWSMARDNQERRDFLLNLLDGAKPSHGYDPLQQILQTKILDPAMGSGHFLVEATDFLARELLRVLSGEALLDHSKEMTVREAKEPYDSKEAGEEDIRWARREVVERCIFGVDLNPLAVELAKLSLWLYTVAKNRPLNFLDHHLRCGNSLIGASIDDLVSLPSLRKKKTENAFKQLGLFENAFREKVAILLKSFELIESLPSDTVEQVREKERHYWDFRKTLSRFQDVADIWTSIYFGNELDFGTYQRLQNKIRSTDEEWNELKQEPWFKSAKAIAEKMRFFHWELEFPEVFFEGQHRKKKPGFDGVVGNPPYGVIFDEFSKSYFFQKFESAEYQIESYALFIEEAIKLLKQKSLHSYITPTTWLSMHYYENLRSLILHDNSLLQVVFFKEPVFTDATVENCIELIGRGKHDQKEGLRLGIVSGAPENMNIRWARFQQARIEKFEGKKISEYLTSETLDLFDKVKEESFLLKDIALMVVGSKPYQVGKGNPPQKKEQVKGRIFDAPFKKNATYKPYLRGEDFHRYCLDAKESRWISYGEWLAEPRPAAPFFVPKKIIIRQTADSIISTIDDQQYLNLNNVHNLTPKIENFSLMFILTLLNSRFLSFMHRIIVPEFGRVFAEVKIVDLEKLPIRRISYVTPKAKKKSLVDEAMDYYQRYFETRNFNALLHFIESRFMKEHLPDPELVKKHNSDPLNKVWLIPDGALWEQSDVVHDILAFLAERMIGMNKEKQNEVKGFINWLENQLKIQCEEKGNTGIEILTGKSRIKNCLGDYQKEEEHLSFEDLWKILEKNKNRIQANLKSRVVFENIKTEYEKSLSQLLPLKQKLSKTDWLIDQIVYKLYGLSQEEIRIVEGQ